MTVLFSTATITTVINTVFFYFMKGGNDYEIFMDSRTVGHTVTSPEDTMKQLKELFNLKN